MRAVAVAPRLVLTSLVLLLGGCNKPAPLSSEAYVWQQTRTPAVDEAIRRSGSKLDGFLLHAADVSFRGGLPRVTRFDASWSAVLDARKPAGFVIRIPYAEGGLGNSPGQVEPVADLIRTTMKTARSLGVSCKEVQLDYDCPESKLGAYTTFLWALKAECPGIRIVFTALPSWLRSAQFQKLARASDGYVLQVHSLTLPGPQDTRIVLCNVEEARATIRKAEKVGVPFRIALPTYQCAVLLDRNGQRVEVASEGSAPAAAEGQRIVPGISDPQELADFTAELKARHSRLLTGILWYRLPVDTDRMNWSWSTFQAVAAGRRPASRLEVSMKSDSRGFATVEIRNAGERDEPLPKLLTVAWQNGGVCEAADGLNGYHAEPATGEAVYRFRLVSPPLFDLPPGKVLVAGWVRVRSASPLHVSVNTR